jgi:glutamate/tyrosine decarboxylase-like PLP-dependent enzyme
MALYILPDHGLDFSTLQDRLTELQQSDWDARGGRLPLHCYFASDAVDQVSQAAYNRFAHANALAPQAFPSCQRMENDVVSMALNLLRASPASAGSITSGGTESIILAIKAARDFALSQRAIGRPNIVIPDSAHPAFDKAAQLMGLVVVRVPVASDLRCDVSAMEAAMDDDTVLVAASAPSLPFGLIDRLGELSEVALRRNVWMHVDACIGGMLAPFVRELGYALPDFDFTLPAVRSMSADLHKFGYAAKGASLVLYRHEADHRFQFSHFSNWPKGEYLTPTLAGTRSGGPIASAWAVMHFLGRQGYLDVTSSLMGLRERFLAAFASIAELEVLGPPELTVVTITSKHLDIFALAHLMRERGWYMSLVARPRAIQQTINLVHEARFGEYFHDLRSCVAAITSGSEIIEHALEEDMVLTY